MDTFLDIQPGISIGLLQLGVTRANLWSLYRCPILSYFSNQWSAERCDEFTLLGVTAHYDAYGMCESLVANLFVQHSLTEFKLAGEPLRNLTVEDLLVIVSHFVGDLETTEFGYRSDTLGIEFGGEASDTSTVRLEWVSVNIPARRQDPLDHNQQVAR